MIYRNLKKGMGKVPIKVKSSRVGSKKLDDEASDDKNQPSSHLGRLEHADVDFNYQFTLDRERRQSNQHNNLYMLHFHCR